jgi:selenocysteine lyase/cysteine desulfurase
MAVATKIWPDQTTREAFPVLSQRVHDKRLVYLDNAATSAKAAIA